MSVDFEESLGIPVSRETMDSLEIFADRVRHWNPRINLVSKNSLPDLMQRHIADSLQLLRLIEGRVRHWADLGSGGGFPGLVLAIAAGATQIDRVTLVESDSRKCAFLVDTIRAMQLNATVINERIETTRPLEADVVSARALAPLTGLLGFAHRHMAKDGRAVFPKGLRHQEEIDEAHKAWTFSMSAVPSKTENGASILVFQSISPKQTGRQG